VRQYVGVRQLQMSRRRGKEGREKRKRNEGINIRQFDDKSSEQGRKILREPRVGPRGLLGLGGWITAVAIVVAIPPDPQITKPGDG